VTAAVVTFDVPVGADNERHDRGQREEFDQTGRPDDRLAKERCQHAGSVMGPGDGFRDGSAWHPQLRKIAALRDDGQLDAKSLALASR